MACPEEPSGSPGRLPLGCPGRRPAPAHPPKCPPNLKNIVGHHGNRRRSANKDSSATRVGAT